MAIYYIDNTHGSHSDFNAGTVAAAPWSTWAKAVATVVAGDTVRVKGSYDESITGTPSGSAGSPITFEAYFGLTATLAPVSSNDHVLSLNNDHYTTWKNIVFDGIGLTNDDACNEIVVLVASTHNRFEDCEMKNSLCNCIQVAQGSNFNTFLRCHGHDYGQTFPFGHPKYNIRDDHGIYINQDSTDNVVDDCEFDHGFGFGIHIYNSGLGGLDRNIVRNCKTHHCGFRDGVQNELTYSSGILATDGEDIQVYNNFSYRNLGRGIMSDFGPTVNLQVLSNTVYHNGNFDGQEGIFLSSVASGARVQNNISFDNGAADIVVPSGTTEDHNLTTDPSFVGAASDDFRILANSDALDAGEDLSAFFTTDHFGTARPIGAAWDIGAHEFGDSIFIDGTAAGSSNINSVTSDAINTTGATLIVVGVSWYEPTSGTPTLVDSIGGVPTGNVWVPLTGQEGTNTHILGFYCINPIVGADHTFTATLTGSYPSIAIQAFNTFGSFNKQAGSNTSGGTSLATGSTTPDVNNSLVVTMISYEDDAQLSIDGGFAISDSLPVTGDYVGIGIAYLKQTTAAAANPIWSWTNSWTAAALIAVFSPVGLTPPTIVSTAALTAPRLAYRVTGATIASVVTLNAPALVYVTTATIASGAVLTPPTVTLVGVSGTRFRWSYELLDDEVIPTFTFLVVDLPTIASAEVLNAPTVAYQLALPTIASGSAVIAPVVSRGPVAVTGATIASTTVLTAPAVAYQTITPTIASSVTLNSPTLAVGAVTVQSPTLASGAVLTTPTLAYTYPVIGATIATSEILNTPTVAPGAVTLDAPTIASTVSMTPPGTGTVISPPTIASGETLNVPSVTTGAVTLEAPTIASGAILNLPSLGVSVSLPTIASGATLNTPAAAYAVTTATIGSTEVLNVPAVGAFNALTLPTIASSASLTEPILAYGVTGTFIGSTAVLNGPSNLTLIISAPTIASGETVTAPTLTTTYAVTLPTIASGAQLFTAAVAPLVQAPTIASTAVLFVPHVTLLGPLTLTLVESSVYSLELVETQTGYITLEDTLW